MNTRLNFDKSWSVQEKIQWCKAAVDYVQCAGKHITNCSIIEVRDDVEQLSSFMEHIIKQANLYCHGKREILVFVFFPESFLGGFYGCEHAITDVRCLLSPRKFYSGEAFDSATETLIINWYLFYSLVLIWWWNR